MACAARGSVWRRRAPRSGVCGSVVWVVCRCVVVCARGGVRHMAKACGSRHRTSRAWHLEGGSVWNMWYVSTEEEACVLVPVGPAPCPAYMAEEVVPQAKMKVVATVCMARY